MFTRNFEKLATQLTPGYVYRRDDLLSHSTAVDRDLARLVKEGKLKKVAAGLYHMPKASRFGNTPPDTKSLVSAFLRDDHFLLFSWNEYNTLGLGLTQLYNRAVVYNHKRHGVFTLDNKEYDFRRPARGFPDQLSPEFLVVDLLNNLNELVDEDTELLKFKIKNNLSPALLKKANDCAKRYGKVTTRKFLAELT